MRVWGGEFSAGIDKRNKSWVTAVESSSVDLCSGS